MAIKATFLKIRLERKCGDRIATCDAHETQDFDVCLSSTTSWDLVTKCNGFEKNGKDHFDVDWRIKILQNYISRSGAEIRAHFRSSVLEEIRSKWQLFA